MKYADLHLHTIFSDGTSTPAELIDTAKEIDLSCISVVDHDTVGGIEQVLEIARLRDIEVLAGIELTAELDSQEIHILGYLIDYKNKALRQKLEILQRNRIERIHKITQKLKIMGIALEPDAIFNLAKQGTVGRLHIARAMLKEGLVNSTAEAFGKYIGDRCPAYVCGFRFTPKEAIRLIKDVGGIAVLAHPYSIKKVSIPLLIEQGLEGLEAYYPEHTPFLVDSYLRLAQKYNLLITGGSDFHGLGKPEVKMGLVKIPYTLVERLKEAKEKNR